MIVSLIDKERQSNISNLKIYDVSNILNSVFINENISDGKYLML